MAPGPQVDGPGRVSCTRQQVSAVAQEVVVAPIKGAAVEARPGGTGGRGLPALAPELGHSPCQGLQGGWRGGAPWGRCITVSLRMWEGRTEEAGGQLRSLCWAGDGRRL